MISLEITLGNQATESRAVSPQLSFWSNHDPRSIALLSGRSFKKAPPMSGSPATAILNTYFIKADGDESTMNSE
jgi:hypothetical protein